MNAINKSTIDLQKRMVFNLAKEKGIENQKAQICVCMDISGSMEPLYRSGFVQRTIERLVPIAMQFDDNGEMELYLFESGAKKHNNNITINNVSGIVQREIINRYSFGGTNYAPPIKMILKDYVKTSGGLFGFGKKKSETMKYPVYVIFITDGQNSDEQQTEDILKEASSDGVFFQFVGIGKANFPLLERLDTLSGRFIDNANFFPIRDLDATPDTELYSKLLGEFPDWLKLAKQHNLIQ